MKPHQNLPIKAVCWWLQPTLQENTMAPSPGNAYQRSPQRQNGVIDSEATDQLQPRRASGGGVYKAYLLPFAFCLFTCAAAATLVYGLNSLRPVACGSFRSSSYAVSSEAVAVVEAVAQLQHNQSSIIALLQNLTSRQERLSGLIGQEHAQSRDQAAAGAAAAAPGNDKVPAAVAELGQLTKLHNSALRASKDYERHRKTVQEVLDKLVHMPAAAAQAEVQQQLSSSAQEPLKMFTYELYKLMLSTGKLIPCREDSTLVVGDTVTLHSKNSSSSSSSSSDSSSTQVPRYYFATNLRDNSNQMPQYTLSLLQTLLRLPRDSVFVSVYESNSDDGVQGWIDVLQLALNVIGTHNRVVTRGMLVRSQGQYRIEFLAQVRNMAMAPLYDHYAQGQLSNLASSTGSSSSSMGPGALPWDPDYVVFINDVYFCWSMVLRLMNYRADITCGTDWWQNKDATIALPPALKNKSHKPKPQIPAELKLEAPIPDPLSPDRDNPIVFYDVWVARDIAGSKFWWTHPFVMEPQSAPAVEAGLPVRASCCWNGLVVLRADPFKRGVRFRMHQEGECRASECTLICNDFARLGYKEVVVDTGVQLAYDWNLAREMMAVGVEGVGQSSWSQVKQAGILHSTWDPAYRSTECCSLKPGAQYVAFYTDCFKQDIMRPNYTEKVLGKVLGGKIDSEKRNHRHLNDMSL